MTKKLVLQALDGITTVIGRKTKFCFNLIDSQYASQEYQQRLLKYETKSSMSRKGNCYNNICLEIVPQLA